MLMIVPYATEQDLEDILRLFKIYVRILGEDYCNETLYVVPILKNKALNYTLTNEIIL